MLATSDALLQTASRSQEVVITEQHRASIKRVSNQVASYHVLLKPNALQPNTILETVLVAAENDAHAAKANGRQCFSMQTMHFNLATTQLWPALFQQHHPNLCIRKQPLISLWVYFCMQGQTYSKFCTNRIRSMAPSCVRAPKTYRNVNCGRSNTCLKAFKQR